MSESVLRVLVLLLAEDYCCCDASSPTSEGAKLTFVSRLLIAGLFGDNMSVNLPPTLVPCFFRIPPNSGLSLLFEVVVSNF